MQLAGRENLLHVDRFPRENERADIGTNEDADDEIAIIVHGKTE